MHRQYRPQTPQSESDLVNLLPLNLEKVLRSGIFFRVQKFDSPISFTGVDIGRFGPEKMENVTANSVLSAKHPPMNNSECYRSRKYVLDPRGVKFGDTPNSHVQVNIRRRSVFYNNFAIELDFRTFHRNGLIFLISVSWMNEWRSERDAVIERG